MEINGTYTKNEQNVFFGDQSVDQAVKDATEVFKAAVQNLKAHPLFNDPNILCRNDGDQA